MYQRFLLVTCFKKELCKLTHAKIQLYTFAAGVKTQVRCWCKTQTQR